MIVILKRIQLDLIGNARHQPGRLGFLFFAIFLLAALDLAAQPNLPVSQLVFEPVPIIDEGSEGAQVTFRSIEDMPGTESGDDSSIEVGVSEVNRINASIEEYLTQIGDKEASEGPYSDQLVQDLFSTGLLHQQLEEHEIAIDYFNRAQNISRVNEGLDTVAQAPMILAKVDSLKALGQLNEADDTFDSLVTIYKDSFGEESEQIVPALLSVGDWNMQAFLERSNIALISKRMDVNQFMTQSSMNGGATAADKAWTENLATTSQPVYKLYLAQNNYFNAINILLKSKNYSHPNLLELERKLITTAFLRTHQENIVYEPDFYLERKTTSTGTRLDTSNQNILNSPDYDVGLQSVKRSLAYISQNPERTHEQVAAAMIAEADWHLLFKRQVVARKKYEEVYKFFSDNPAFGEYAGDSIYPAVPVVLPNFLPAPNSREKFNVANDEEIDYFGYFDVSFNISRNGKAGKIKINGQGGQVTKNMEMRLNEYLRKVLFRPRYDQKGKLDTGLVKLRYFVGA